MKKLGDEIKANDEKMKLLKYIETENNKPTLLDKVTNFCKEDKFKKESQLVHKLIEALNPKVAFKKIAMELIHDKHDKEGK